MNPEPPFASEAVGQRYAAYPDELQDALLRLRALVFEVAGGDGRVGVLEEALRWNEPSYLTSASKSGTTLRVSSHKSGDGVIALYFNCQTSLAERYRELYGDVLQVDGNRAVVLPIGEDWPEDALRHAIAMALTYHLR